VKISVLANLAGVTPKTVRFYESAGILPPAARDANRYRVYSDADLCRLRLVVTMRGLGLDLTESGRLAALCAVGHCDEMRDDLSAQIAQRRQEIKAARADLEHLEGELASAQDALQAGEPIPNLCIGKEECDDPVRLSLRPSLPM
jgi:DNA-binding transcriptional MerR regulator